ncbi:NAD(P)/FAD-dependent oxidoreductase [Streptomyces sp. NPDC058653]|uniref:NAD(P)/FAD-dependent oxidoreductase n=1 Tax=Streptomyces sp. NPDC058653 TaxID=3346576 RepID=UPI003656E4A1
MRRRPSAVSPGHAVVVGGGISGLFTARVLADFVSRVTVVERDAPDAERAFRSGTPQARHPHLLLARSQRVMEELFPGIWDGLADVDAPVFDFGLRSRMLFGEGFAAPIPTGIMCRSVSRPMLEAAVRREVLALPGVVHRPGYAVTGLVHDAARDLVTGVRVAPHRHSGGEGPHVIDADLVIDAGGRGSHLAEWMAACGLPRPRTRTVDPRLGYATRRYAIPDDVKLDWNVLVEFTRPPTASRGCVCLTIENRQLLCTLQGAGGDLPPGDEEGFLRFADSLRIGLTDVVKNLPPLSPIYCYRNTVNAWRMYHRLARWPRGLLVVGDANCVFNPIYGQGITVAANEALLLRDMLTARGHRGLHRALRGHRRRQARIIRRAWLLSTTMDRGWQPGPLPAGAKVLHRLMDAWLESAPASADMYRRFLGVMHMVSGVRVLLAPRAVTRIAATLIRGRRRPVEQPSGRAVS